MQIEARGSLTFLEEFSVFLRREFEKNGYSEGPSVARMNVGHCWTLVQNRFIVSLQLNESDEAENAMLRLESEQDVPRMDEIWDNALVALGNQFMSRLRRIARNSKRIEQVLS
jgi:hypothetical protein